MFEKDSDIIVAIDDIFLKNNWVDLDCTYSKGVFYNNIRQPKIKSDLIPQYEDVIEADCTKLDFVADGTLNSVVFDPPFLFRKRKSANVDKMSARFTYFNSYEELQDMYKKSMDCIYRKLRKGGYLCFKCQDMTDGKFYCTHNFIINYAESIGFNLRDIMIKKAKSKIQKDARQQNCVAKVHSYWLIFRK